MGDENEFLKAVLSEIRNTSEYNLTELGKVNVVFSDPSNEINRNNIFPANQEMLSIPKITSTSHNVVTMQQELRMSQSTTDSTNLEIENNVSSNDDEDQLIEALKEIDQANWKYIFQRCTDLRIKYTHLAKMDRHHIDLLVPIQNLGCNISFCHGLKKWKEKNDLMQLTSTNTLVKDKQGLSQRGNYFTLKEIIKGKFNSIRKSYEKNKLLLPKDRNELVKSIVDFFKSKNISMNVSIFKNIARQITEYFPGESESYYYLKKPGKRAKGKLINRYINLSRCKDTDKEKQDFTEDEHKSSDTIDKSNRTTFEFELAEKGGKNEMQWLKHNKGPFDKILDLWKETLEYRKKYFYQHSKDPTVYQILQDWPSYTLPDGYLLIDMDFSYKFGIMDVDFYENWSKFESSVLKIFDTELKNKSGKELFQKFLVESSSLCADSKHAIIIQLMHNLLVPTQMYREEKSKKLKKYSIMDSQLSVIRILQEPVDLDSAFQISTPIQPFILLIGDDIFHINKNIVYFDNKKFECGNFLKCLNTCYKIFNVFNLEYPKPAKNFWYFVQKVLFRMSIDTHILPPEAHNVISKLKLNS